MKNQDIPALGIVTNIHVPAPNNEILLTAFNSSGPRDSFRLLYRREYDQSADIVPGKILKPGDYYLVMIGVNWGSGLPYSVIVTAKDLPSKTFTGGGDNRIGANWNQIGRFTVDRQ